ncbi:MAG: hydrogenase maturation protease [Anaerolineae bacterium]|nr:hydrogenase maturation protease [Anaerolineae bacterium]MDW8071898.1 hydrogenase maturation protease [Anaerolineae bacterium]
MKTLVLGLGNPILGDDGVGVRVAEAVRASLPPDAPVDVCELSVGGLRLMEHMLGYERVILIDALQPGHAEPGTFRRLSYTELARLCPMQHGTCIHDTSFVTALEMAQRMALPLPREIIIYAIGVQDVEHFSEELTPAVARALPRVLAAVLQELNLSAQKEESHGLT